jgi:hypothetical protein
MRFSHLYSLDYSFGIIKNAVTHLLGKVEIKEMKSKKDAKTERNGISAVICNKVKPELNKLVL